MLVRNENGSTFHIVSHETRRFYQCLCGLRIMKNNPNKQLLPDGRYSRCWKCRKLQNQALARSPGLKVYRD